MKNAKRVYIHLFISASMNGPTDFLKSLPYEFNNFFSRNFVNKIRLAYCKTVNIKTGYIFPDKKVSSSLVLHKTNTGYLEHVYLQSTPVQYCRLFDVYLKSPIVIFRYSLFFIYRHL